MAGNHIIDLIIYTTHHYITQLAKKMRQNGPVAVETACLSSKGRMMEEVMGTVTGFGRRQLWEMARAWRQQDMEMETSQCRQRYSDLFSPHNRCTVHEIFEMKLLDED